MPIKKVAIVGEDELSLAILTKLLNNYQTDACIEYSFLARGFGNIKTNISKYINASQVLPHVILTDLDNYTCARSLFTDWNITVIPPRCLFRIAVKEVEAWILSDRQGVADLLGIQLNKIPPYPEQVQDPKEVFLNLAKKSRRKGLSAELVSKNSANIMIGPLYNFRMCEFVRNSWNVELAIQNSNSLSKAVSRITELQL
ncbi:MAG TPA: hypothetical protein PL131_11430 [Methylotenera sp.]|nr:hypothetical protein [Methylotenera sp.]HPH06477.1 hypothetical protein [Methylotenera sp.]HPN01238.1 hypothetical protein [Methylotenera sp.]